MSGTHFMEVCADHGTILHQCKCPGPKTTREVPCPGPEVCQPGTPVPDLLVNLVLEYEAEMENPAPDFTMRRVLRERLFNAAHSIRDDASTRG